MSLALLACLDVHAVNGQPPPPPPPPPAVVTLVVYAIDEISGLPIEGANVSANIGGTVRIGTTGAGGFVRYAGIEPGTLIEVNVTSGDSGFTFSKVPPTTFDMPPNNDAVRFYGFLPE
jgi:hypothetical protein